MDWIKFSRAKLKEKEIDEVHLLKEFLFVDEKRSIDAIKDLSSRPEWTEFLDTLEKTLNKGTSDIDINESAYQYLYDESNDWYRQEFTSTDVQNAFAIGALWMRKLMEKKNNL